MDIAEKILQLKVDFDGVYDSGKREEQRKFWENFTKSGEKGEYYYSFSENRWNNQNFVPLYDIIPTEADHMFYRHNYGNSPYDLAKQFMDCGSRLDFSNCTLGNYTFESAAVSRIPEIDNSKGTFTCFFRNCKNLHTIDKIICNNKGDQNFTQTFGSCNLLENVLFEGVIGRSIGFQNSPLTADSLKNIILHLADYAGTENEYVYTLTVKSSAFQTLENEENTAEYNGVACTWAELVDNKKWNLVKA